MKSALTISAALLLLASCSKKGLGEECTYDSQCEAGYTCFRGVCNTLQKRDEVLTTQSGAGAAPIERPAAGGERVKVRVTHGEGLIFAACAASERLVGGGCKGGENCESEHDCHFLRSYPGGFSPEDTLGARWICTGAHGTMQAYALCQETKPATTTAPPSDLAPTPPSDRPPWDPAPTDAAAPTD